MSVWNSSSLGFSDHNLGRHSSGLLKNLKARISKQHLTEHKMFGSKRKGIQLGKSFKRSGKGIVKSIKNTAKPTSPKGKGISPSIPEFDKMMNSISKGSFDDSNGSNGKKKMFSRKSFG